MIPPVAKVRVETTAAKEAHVIDKDLFQQALETAKELAEANMTTDAGMLETQYHINTIAMQELDAMKNDRKTLLVATEKLCKKYDFLKVKYDDLLDKYKYLKNLKKKDNSDDQ